MFEIGVMWTLIHDPDSHPRGGVAREAAVKSEAEQEVQGANAPLHNSTVSLSIYQIYHIFKRTQGKKTSDWSGKIWFLHVPSTSLEVHTLSVGESGCWGLHTFLSLQKVLPVHWLLSTVALNGKVLWKPTGVCRNKMRQGQHRCSTGLSRSFMFLLEL